MSNNVIEELSKDDEANADSDVGEAGPSSKKVAEVQPFKSGEIDFDDNNHRPKEFTMTVDRTVSKRRIMETRIKPI